MSGRGRADERTEYECVCRAPRHVEPSAGVLVPFGALICKARFNSLCFFGATLDFRRAKWGRWWLEGCGWLSRSRGERAILRAAAALPWLQSATFRFSTRSQLCSFPTTRSDGHREDENAIAVVRMNIKGLWTKADIKYVRAPNPTIPNIYPT